MKKLLITLFLLSTLSISGFSAGKNLTGVGIYGNLIGGGAGNFGTGIGLTLKFGNFPVLGAEWMFGDASRIAVSCDYWIVNDHLTGALNYYLGVGGFLGIGIAHDNAAIDFGGRIPIGLQIIPVNNFEIFAEFAPLVGFFPTLNLNFALRLGIRVHF
ncbi:MAG: hypothetical protein ACP5QT_06155 [Brevinematia bacterium]